VQVNIKDDADEDLVEYINTLRVSILEAYTGIMQGLKEAKKQEMVLPAIDAIRDLLQVMILPFLPLMAFLGTWPPHAPSASPVPCPALVGGRPQDGGVHQGGRGAAGRPRTGDPARPLSPP